MDQHERAGAHDEASLAWFGHPPEGAPEAAPDATGVEEPAPRADTDVYERVITSAIIVGGALLLARSRTFRVVTWRLAKFALTTWLPARLASEVRHAWRDAAPQTVHAAPPGPRSEGAPDAS